MKIKVEMDSLNKSLNSLSLGKERKLIFYKLNDKRERIIDEDEKERIDYISIKIRSLKFRFIPGTNKIIKILSFETDDYGVDVLDEDEY